jgi:hypothetical protein
MMVGFFNLVMTPTCRPDLQPGEQPRIRGPVAITEFRQHTTTDNMEDHPSQSSYIRDTGTFAGPIDFPRSGQKKKKAPLGD